MATRAFPSYNLANLKAFVVEAEFIGPTFTPKIDAVTLAKIKAEIEAREAGLSVHKPTPQVAW